MNDTTWNLTDMYKTEEDFNKDLEKAHILLEQYANLKGKLNTEEAILKRFQIDEELGETLEKLYCMRSLKKDEKLDDEKANKKYQEIVAFYQEVCEKIVFADSEILENSEEFLKNMMEKEPQLKRYKNSIIKLIKEKPHVLSVEVEEALSCFDRPLGAFSSIFEKLNDSDFTFEDAIDSNGKKYKVTQEKANMYLESHDRTLRKTAFYSRMAEYEKFAHTITEIYVPTLQRACAEAKLRKYPSYFEKRMEDTDSTIKVYDSLIEAVNKYLPINHKYFELRKKLLGYDKMNHYDNFVQIIPNVEVKKYTYEEAKELVLKAVAPLGEQYLNDLKRAFESSWSDVYEKDKKRSGAYSCGVYGVHPYVLQNFNGTYMDVSTTIHEFGHAMHSYYSAQSQEYPDSDYRIMVAEVASTVNETLLAEYIIANETDKKKKAAYIMEQIKDINSTLVRQTMFAEFEKWVHEETRKGNELTCEEISNYYLSLVIKYFGDSIEVNDVLKYEWARIPHFYTPFYVYQYATGVSAAIDIVTNILERGEEYTHKYLEMLHMGGSILPLDELRHAEVDLESDEPVKKAFEFYERKINELEKLANEIAKENK